MKNSKAYTVEYKLYSADYVRSVQIFANSKAVAYDLAYYDVIPTLHEYAPYSAWVASVTYKNGNYKRFNTFEGNPY